MARLEHEVRHMKISMGRSKIVRYVPELTYGRPGIQIVLGRLLRGGGNIQASGVGGLVRYEAPCTDEQWQTALWCCGVDPSVSSAEPGDARPTRVPHRPYICLEWQEAGARHLRVVRIADRAVMWTGISDRPHDQIPIHHPGWGSAHADWLALSTETRGAVLRSLRFLEVPPPTITLAAQVASFESRFDLGSLR